MVLFASPGMLHAGTSLDVFKKWCHDPKNMIILPGYCVPGRSILTTYMQRFTKFNIKVLLAQKFLQEKRLLKLKREVNTMSTFRSRI
jgi:Cft2 family RNA processing exonuclease